MRVIDIENITEAMRDDTRFVLRCEEVFHDKISAAAASILMNKSQKPLVCLTGPSGSGKTTTAMRLKAYLENLGVKVCLLSMDNFFLPLADRPPELTDWESPLCVNRDLLIDCIHRLSDGEEVELPVYDFKSGTTGSWFRMQGDRDAVIIAEGIHCTAAYADKRALAICSISDNLVTGKELSADERQTTFTNMMKIALEVSVKMENKE